MVGVGGRFSFAAGVGGFESFCSVFGHGRDVVGWAVIDQFGGVGWGRRICVGREAAGLHEQLWVIEEENRKQKEPDERSDG